MSPFHTVAAAVLAATLALAPAAQARDFDPSALKPAVPGAPNELMVLGTPHLSDWPEDFDPALLEGLLDRLAAWHPGIIAVESLSGAQCDLLRRYPDRYAETVEDYCWDPAPARAATGLGVPAAVQAAERMLADWPADPAPAQRRHLAALFLASGDQESALVQWLRLPEAERHEGDGLDTTLAARLATLRTRHNEVFLIAAPLAARLGLERLVPMDDHSADTAIPKAEEAAYEAAITKVWANPAVERRNALDERLMAGIGTAQGVLAAYRGYNAAEQAQLVYESDFGAALTDTSPQQFGRQYVGYWETRNLRMAANIRDAMGLAPGKRTLVIVGLSHKWYLEAYLDQMHDLHLADSEAILR